MQKSSSIVESKFKYLQGNLISLIYSFNIGEASKSLFEGITPSDSQTESCFVRSNGVFTAVSIIPINFINDNQVPWKCAGGGVIAVVKAFDYKRFEADIPLIKGHGGPINDFEFSPFNDSLLATASDDGSIKFWIIPEEGIIKDRLECDAELRGHSRKLIFSKFHPCADNTMASSSADMSVRIWDIQN